MEERRLTTLTKLPELPDLPFSMHTFAVWHGYAIHVPSFIGRDAWSKLIYVLSLESCEYSVVVDMWTRSFSMPVGIGSVPCPSLCPQYYDSSSLVSEMWLWNLCLKWILSCRGEDETWAVERLSACQWVFSLRFVLSESSLQSLTHLWTRQIFLAFGKLFRAVKSHFKFTTL